MDPQHCRSGWNPCGTTILPVTDTFELPIERLKTAFAGLFYSLAEYPACFVLALYPVNNLIYFWYCIFVSFKNSYLIILFIIKIYIPRFRNSEATRMTTRSPLQLEGVHPKKKNLRYVILTFYHFWIILFIIFILFYYYLNMIS